MPVTLVSSMSTSNDAISEGAGSISPEFGLSRLQKPRPPYNDGAFWVQITFPVDYPFRPPIPCLKTPIYHPNIDEKGYMCLAIVQYDNWKPATNVYSIIQSLVFLLNDPEPERPLRPKLAEQLYKDKQAFMKAAMEHTKKNAEKRPA